MYYDSCSNYESIEREKGSPLLGIIEKYGSWNITNKTWTSDSWDFMKTLAQMHKYLKLSPLFTFQVQPDLMESSRYIIMVLQVHVILMYMYIKEDFFVTQGNFDPEGRLSFKLATITLLNVSSRYIKICNFIVFCFSLHDRHSDIT